MAQQQRTRSRDKISLEKLRVQRFWDTFLRLGSLFIGRGLKWGYYAFLTWQARLAMEAFAGKETATSLIMSLGTNVSVAVGVSWASTIVFAIWVFLERRLRKGTAERLTLRIKDLELVLDRQRSSSLLTTRGDTRPEDQV
jgi:hypothetical protein